MINGIHTAKIDIKIGMGNTVVENLADVISNHQMKEKIEGKVIKGLKKENHLIGEIAKEEIKDIITGNLGMPAEVDLTLEVIDLTGLRKKMIEMM